jgi:hypothetical protein
VFASTEHLSLPVYQAITSVHAHEPGIIERAQKVRGNLIEYFKKQHGHKVKKLDFTVQQYLMNAIKQNKRSSRSSRTTYRGNLSKRVPFEIDAISSVDG